LNHSSPPADIPSWPHTGEARPRATFKATADDFRVEELLPFQPTGDGEHLFVRMEKRDIGTPELARLLADAHGIEHVDVGYAGMKDTRAVARQWFSLRGVSELDPAAGDIDGTSVLEVARHRQKLRRGELGGNVFTIVLRDPGPGDVTGALETLASCGAPNYFGEQRFGWDNLPKAAAWLARRRRARLSRFKQGLYLSVLRGFLFNEVLAARVRAGTWSGSVCGDVADARGLPTGPLWGRGRSTAAAAAADIEAQALAPHQALLDGLEHAGLTQARRALVCLPAGFRWSWEGPHLRVGFTLGPGEYATSLLGDQLELRTPDRSPRSSEGSDGRRARGLAP
jgi:tRNA pseudouridine13 synthase